MSTCYRVKDWAKHFENNRTRELKHMAWVPIPNKMDGDGYTELVSHKDGATHFGIWCALLEVASKCDVRGTLLRDGGKAHDADSLSRVTRLPASAFHAAIPRLISIGWLETCGESQADAAIPQADAAIPQATDYGTEQNGTEGKELHTPPTPSRGDGVGGQEDPDFEAFWKAYPRKVGKKAAIRAWDKAKDKPDIAFIVASLEKQKQSEQWTKDGGQFIPNLATWLNQGRWDDEPAERQVLRGI